MSDLTPQMVAVSELKEYKFSKEIFEDLATVEYAALKNDIAKHGIKVPLHILPDKTVICGHQRLRAAKELDLKTVPCEIKNLKDDNEIKEWAIKDNLIRRQLTPEQKYLLYAKLSEIYEVGRGTYGRGRPKIEKDTVSSSNVLERTAREVGENPKTIARARAYSKAINARPELKGKPVSWAIKEHQKLKEIAQRKRDAKDVVLKNMLCGDALTEVKKMPDESIDCVVTDPPYGIGYKSHGLRQTTRAGWDSIKGDTPEIYTYTRSLAKELFRVMKKDSDLYCFSGWKESFCSFYLAFERAGFKVQDCIVWVKDARTAGPDFSHRYAHIHEFIIYAKKGNRFLNRPFSLDVLNFAKIHSDDVAPTEKPVPLLKYLISNSTVEGEVVLDPFCGSGSTLEAAEELKRNWIGNDIDKNFYELSKARIVKLRGGA
jgi:site-specific DNA-methyltransferase (adenine-specific)